MNIHEHEAKDILKKFGIPIQDGIAITDISEAEKALDTIEKELCNILKENLSILSKKRVVELAYPILDFRDLNYLDSLSSVSYSAFMNNSIKRYDLENWIVCLVRDDFGIILEEPKCFSSVSESTTNLDTTFNHLINPSNVFFASTSAASLGVIVVHPLLDKPLSLTCALSS